MFITKIYSTLCIGYKTQMRVSLATVKDVEGISFVIKQFSKKNQLLAKKENELYQRINDFFVLKNEDSEIIGCGSIYIYSDEYAELCSLAVLSEYQHHGGGALLANAIVDRARALCVQHVFTLTYVPNFFKKISFVEIDKDELPHKIWKDCINCQYFPKCNETALILNL